MQITTRDVELYADNSLMRTYVAQPCDAGRYPGILLYSEIFQLTGPIIRACHRLAGYGFVVAAPEIYHRLERPGTVMVYDDIGRMWGNADAARTPVAAFDADCRAVLDWLGRQENVASDQLGTMGFCIGGHLAFRAALQPEVKAAVCCYPTNLHDGRIGGRAEDVGTLQRAGEIQGEVLVVFGIGDPHIGEVNRAKIADQLKGAGVKHRVLNLEGEHAFMRDEGPRYDAASTDTAYGEAVALFKRVFQAEQ
jgi:carboxymethylenebutenolidase